MIVVQTPLRISFLGGGTDFKDFYASNGGAVLSTAIDKCIFVVVKERFDDMIYVNYSKKEIVKRVDGLKHELVREAMKLTGVDRGVEITTLADVLGKVYTFNRQYLIFRELPRIKGGNRIAANASNFGG